jgi:hypothetical protein
VNWKSGVAKTRTYERHDRSSLLVEHRDAVSLGIFNCWTDNFPRRLVVVAPCACDAPVSLSGSEPRLPICVDEYRPWTE